jgi:hypothetical protein
VWRRAEEIPLPPYLDLVRRLLEWPALIGDFPAQPFDPNEPGAPRAVSARLVIGDEEWRAEALRGESYDRLKPVVDIVLDFVRRVPAVVETDARPPGTTPRATAPPRAPATPPKPPKKKP